jgi:molybdopterin-containing oxidoreductase family membrane subunit
MDHNMYKFKKTAGMAAFVWRLILTTGTGSIFGFLVARSAYDAALLAPMFIVMSFAFGLAIFILVLMASYHWSGRELGDEIVARLRNLLGVFIAAVLYFVAVYHLTNLYITEHHGFEKFILMEGGSYTKIFWIGQIILGGLIPLALVYAPGVKNCRKTLSLICALVILGGLATMYTVIIAGQAYPLQIFPGYEVTSSFFDGVVNDYTPSIYEIALGVGGVAVSLLIVAFVIKVLPFLPKSLADSK